MGAVFQTKTPGALAFHGGARDPDNNQTETQWQT